MTERIRLGEHHSFDPAQRGRITCRECGSSFTEETMWYADVAPCADGAPTGYTEEQAMARAKEGIRQTLTASF